MGGGESTLANALHVRMEVACVTHSEGHKFERKQHKAYDTYEARHEEIDAYAAHTEMLAVLYSLLVKNYLTLGTKTSDLI